MSSSSVARTLLRAGAIRQQPLVSNISRPFSQSAVYALKESESTDPSSAQFEHHKQDAIKKAKEGKAHWKAELASNSEENIRADKHNYGSSKEDIKKLQEETKSRAEETRKAGTSMTD
ncbi:hypothetical protein QBC38DRAFT_475208 [Podospora fimiseda]|uniref:Mitochondrial carrier protein pet8 n=1 Tax=Podospora fimiseda TaxID=252190 RepID=A0AAN7H3T7_9PEZI|nr:hypothetical protein QBC38DRAFT_475208 [Podospora fimiseda]